LIQQASGFSSITVTAESSLSRSRQVNYFGQTPGEKHPGR
jgi:hypothetical protein